MKKILVPTRFVPWPPIEGGRVAQYRSYEACVGACEFHLLVAAYNAEEEQNAVDCNGRLPNLFVRTVRCYVPTAPRSKPQRLLDILRKYFRRPLPAANQEREQRPMPDYPFHHMPSVYLDELEKELSQDYDLVQVEYIDLLTLAPFLYSRVPALFLHLQLHFVYAQRFVEAYNSYGPQAKYLLGRITTEEKAYLTQFDAVMVLSETDKSTLTAFCPGLDVHVSPFPYPEEPVSGIQDTKPLAHYVFVASESHKPNFDGLCWFMSEVWPEIQLQVPRACIEVIGKWGESSQNQVPHHDLIRFSGFVEELVPALQGKIMVVPLWIGSGVRTKILAAWEAGCPVVTTTIGIEGLPGEAGRHFLLADDRDTFAGKCTQLVKDTYTWRALAKSGHALVQQQFSLEAVKQRRLEVYEEVVTAWRKRREGD